MDQRGGRVTVIYNMDNPYNTWIAVMPTPLEDTCVIRPAIELMLSNHLKDMENELDNSVLKAGWDLGYLTALKDVLKLIDMEDEFMLLDLQKRELNND